MPAFCFYIRKEKFTGLEKLCYVSDVFYYSNCCSGSEIVLMLKLLLAFLVR